MFANAPNAAIDSSRRLRQRGPQPVSYAQNVEDDSGYDAEDNLEAARHSDYASAVSPESYSDDRGAAPGIPQQPEHVARKRAKQACDYCRAKKCKARPNARRIANVSAQGSLSARSVERMRSFATSHCITER